MEQANGSYFAQIKNWGLSMRSGEWLSSLDVIKLGVCFGASFLIGLLLKKSFKYIILYGLSFIIGLSALHYFNIINVDVTKIKDVVGLADINSWSEMTGYIAQQMKIHIVEVTASSIGLILGFKVG